MNADDRLFHADQLLHLKTSGTTAQPKGVMRSTGGNLTGVTTGVTATHSLVRDLKPDRDVCCSAPDRFTAGLEDADGLAPATQ
jgi:acyl-coenzyme A synthetase/AMP-(fatty) acid ligase